MLYLEVVTLVRLEAGLMAKSWNGYTIICGGEKGCRSEDIKSLPDANYSYGDYEVFECNECGQILRIELPD